MPNICLFSYLCQMFKQNLQIRWADIDANRHLRHSVYYDFGASMRMDALSSEGLTMQKLVELKMGPILFREEAIFKREILFGDEITIDVEIVRSRKDFSRWSLRHNLVKADGTLAAIINIDGAWIDLVKRKLTVPDEFIVHIFEKFPRSQDFEFVDR